MLQKGLPEILYPAYRSPHSDAGETKKTGIEPVL
jgi:hypothetical protein